MTDKKAVRESAMLFLSPEVAAFAGITLQELQQVIAGTKALSDEQWRRLARRMRLEE